MQYSVDEQNALMDMPTDEDTDLSQSSAQLARPMDGPCPTLHGESFYCNATHLDQQMLYWPYYSDSTEPGFYDGASHIDDDD